MASTHQSFDQSPHGYFTSSTHGARGNVPTQLPNIWKFDGTTGEVLGSWHIGGVLKALDVVGSKVYVGGTVANGKNFWCLDTDGAEQWSALTNTLKAQINWIRARSGFVASCDNFGINKWNDAGSLQWRSGYGSQTVELGVTGKVWTNYGGLTLFNSATGARVWTRDIGMGQYFPDNIAAGSDDSTVSSITGVSKKGHAWFRGDGTSDGYMVQDIWPLGRNRSGIVSLWVRSHDDDTLSSTHVQTGLIYEYNPPYNYSTPAGRINVEVPDGDPANNKMFDVFTKPSVLATATFVDPGRFGWPCAPAVTSGANRYIPVYGSLTEQISWGRWPVGSVYYYANPELWDAYEVSGAKVTTPQALGLDGDGNVWII